MLAAELAREVSQEEEDATWREMAGGAEARPWTEEELTEIRRVAADFGGAGYGDGVGAEGG